MALPVPSPRSKESHKGEASRSTKAFRLALTATWLGMSILIAELATSLVMAGSQLPRYYAHAFFFTVVFFAGFHQLIPERTRWFGILAGVTVAICTLGLCRWRFYVTMYETTYGPVVVTLAVSALLFAALYRARGAFPPSQKTDRPDRTTFPSGRDPG